MELLGASASETRWAARWSVATLFVASGGVATSGDYERFFEVEGRRYSHAINQRLGGQSRVCPQ